MRGPRMRSATSHFTIETAQADALFASALQHSDGPTATQIRQAIAAAIRIFGARGCAAQVAQAYGEHPETGGRTDAMGTRRGRWHGFNRRVNLTAKPRNALTRLWPLCSAVGGAGCAYGQMLTARAGIG